MADPTYTVSYFNADEQCVRILANLDYDACVAHLKNTHEDTQHVLVETDAEPPRTVQDLVRD